MINIKGVANNPEERYKKYRETLRQKYLYRIGEQYENLTIVDIVKSEKKHYVDVIVNVENLKM